MNDNILALGNHNFLYHTCCFIAKLDGVEKPFGFCKKCWIEHGKPEGMK